MQKLPVMVAVPEIWTLGPPTAVRPLIARQVRVARLGVPTEMPMAALGVMLSTVTLTRPTWDTLNGWTLVPKRFSVPVNGSLIVASTGVGASGGVGSLQPPLHTASDSAIARPVPAFQLPIRPIVPFLPIQ